MTDPLIEQLDLLDTDYANILANSSYPSLELQLLRIGVDSAGARTTSTSSPAVRQKPETPEQWATLTEAWFVACQL